MGLECSVLRNWLTTKERSWTGFEVLDSKSIAKGSFRGGIMRPTQYEIELKFWKVKCGSASIVWTEWANIGEKDMLVLRERSVFFEIREPPLCCSGDLCVHLYQHINPKVCEIWTILWNPSKKLAHSSRSEAFPWTLSLWPTTHNVADS